MQVAYEEALKAYEKGEVPVGACIVKGGKLISATHNLVEQSNNPNNHAELLCLNEAHKKLSTRFLTNCDLYVTLEPCHMCASAISASRIKNLYFATDDQKTGAIHSGAKLYSNKYVHHKPEIFSNIMESQCTDLLKKFFSELR